MGAFPSVVVLSCLGWFLVLLGVVGVACFATWWFFWAG